ncbi:septum formation initiator family protein [Candidatus Nitronereus thalassa]|uniref:Septum formation initiator family protein n=1 Tax=Candidatus Nitronereus thalassa TaxID=3020898 RepID=A0ABU3KC82_9BACT|nr:septum formation initiator family protein [Candidatus Nitronereus thalassa]MDT7043998.1 septum formation initiator family protein [Candidatus Nitronereus thalassa]
MIRANCKRVANTPQKIPIPRAWQRPLALAVGIALLAMWLLEGAEVTQSLRMADELERMNQEIAQLQQANASLEQEIHLVQHDRFTLEKLARERLGYVKEGEVVYQLVEAQ